MKEIISYIPKGDWYLPIGPIDKSRATLAPTVLSIIAMQAVMHVKQCHHGNQYQNGIDQAYLVNGAT